MNTKPRWHHVHRNNRVLYAVVATLLIVLMVFGMIAFALPTDNEEARSKATELISAFEQAGLPAPSADFVVGTFGTDGGAVCEHPGDALAKAAMNQQLSNGAAHTGVRPVQVAYRVVQGEALILSVYCPDQLPAFRDYVAGLKFADVIRT
ncbi:MAG: hypothetical protein ACJ72N_06085 [Labedaea sp.]